MRKQLSVMVVLCMLVACIPIAHAEKPQPVFFNEDGTLNDYGMEMVKGGAPDVEYRQVIIEGGVDLYAEDPETGEWFLALTVYGGYDDYPYPTVISRGFEVGPRAKPPQESDVQLESGILNVPKYQQDTYNCWAACCAMIIAYKMLTFRSASELCEEVTGSTDVSGGWSEIKQCYNNYGLYPSQISGICSYSTVRNYITADQPLHIGCVQLDSNANDTSVKHSMVLTGFNGTSGVCYLYANDPSSGTRVYTIVDSEYTVNDTVKFTIDGNIRVRWNMTRYGFYPNREVS